MDQYFEHNPHAQRLQAGQVHQGTVVASDPARESYSVEVEDAGHLVEAEWAAPLLLGLIGFKFRGRLPVGTRVLCTGGAKPVILATLNTTQADINNWDGRPTTWGLAPETVSDLLQEPGPAEEMAFRGARQAGNDLLDGEFELSNHLGSTLRMLMNMASIASGELARVETHLLNDMVRVVAGCLRIHSALGDEELYDDGRLHGVEHATSYPGEAMGEQPGAKEKVKLDETTNQPDLSDIDAVLDTGRWRWSRYMGFLGDFVHAFVTDPQGAVRATIGQEDWRSGKNRVQFHNDGGILVQSVTEIALERVCRIPVPRQVKRHDDPEGVLRKDYDRLERSWLKVVKLGSDPTDFPRAAYQLREYARWFAGYRSFARFLQIQAKGDNKDWEVPVESDVPAPHMSAKEPDREQAIGDATPGTDYTIDTYACIRIMRNGGIVLLDGAGHSLVLPGVGGGQVQLTSTADLRVEAAGDLQLIAGRNIELKARRHIEGTAVRGGIVWKARTWWRGLCEQGSMWLKSDAFNPLAGTSPSPSPEEGDPQPDVMEHAVILEAPNGAGMVRAGDGNMVVESRGTLRGSGDEGDTTCAVHLLAEHDVRVKARRGLYVRVLRMALRARDLLTAKSRHMYLCGQRILHLHERLQWKAGVLHVDGSIRCKKLAASSRISTVAKARGKGPHTNHVSVIRAGEEAVMDTDLQERDKALDGADVQKRKAWNNRPVWRWLDKDSWKRATTTRYETLSQQYLRLEDPSDVSVPGEWDVWDWYSDQTLNQGDARNTTSVSWPGRPDSRWERHEPSVETLYKPATSGYDAYAKTTPTRKQRIEFRWWTAQ